MSIENIQELLLDCYSKEDNLDESNEICAITSLIINDYFGGVILKNNKDGISHYYNLIENEIIDLTPGEFNCDINYENYQIVDRQEILTEEIKNRYNILKKKIINKLLKQVDEEVSNCKSCNKLVDKFPNSATVFLGKDNDIVLVGEAPANNGWRKSNRLWCDINGKVLPSGVVL